MGVGSFRFNTNKGATNVFNSFIQSSSEAARSLTE